MKITISVIMNIQTYSTNCQRVHKEEITYSAKMKEIYFCQEAHKLSHNFIKAIILIIFRISSHF